MALLIRVVRDVRMPFGKGGIGSAKAVWEFAWSGGLRFRRRPDLEIRSAELWGDMVAVRVMGLIFVINARLPKATKDGTDSVIQRFLSACSHCPHYVLSLQAQIARQISRWGIAPLTELWIS